VEFSTSITVMQCLLAIGEERRVRNQKLYIYIYRSGDAGVSFRGCNISSWGSSGIALLPSVGDWGGISSACMEPL
jgi:hypothetical protein